MHYSITNILNSIAVQKYKKKQQFANSLLLSLHKVPFVSSRWCAPGCISCWSL